MWMWMWMWMNILTEIAHKKIQICIISILALSNSYPIRMEWSRWQDSAKGCSMQKEILMLLVTVGRGKNILSMKFNFVMYQAPNEPRILLLKTCCLRSTHNEGTFSYLSKYVITGRIGVKYKRLPYSLYLIKATRPQIGRLWSISCRLNVNMDLWNGCI